MKVSYQGKVKCVNKMASSMSELRKNVNRKFKERDFFEDNHGDNSDLNQSTMSSLMQSEQNMRSFLEQSIQNSSKKSRKNQNKIKIDWAEVTLFYEDSEGDLNVISEDEDLYNAMTYAKSKQVQHLQCSILDRTTFDKVRQEQLSSDQNQSQTWYNLDIYRKQSQEPITDIPEKKLKMIQKMIQVQLGQTYHRELQKSLLSISQSRQLAQSNQIINQTTEKMSQLQINQPQQVQQQEIQGRDRAVSGNSFNGDQSVMVNKKFKSKMAQVVGPNEQLFQLTFGDNTRIRWTIKNKSSFEWPMEPDLVNANTGELVYKVQGILKPDETMEIVFPYQIPQSAFGQSMQIIKLNLCDPIKNEKFGDTLTGICQVLTKPARQQPDLVVDPQPQPQMPQMPTLNMNALGIQQPQLQTFPSDSSGPGGNTERLIRAKAESMSKIDRLIQNATGDDGSDDDQFHFTPDMRPSDVSNVMEPSMIVDSNDQGLDHMESSDYKELIAKMNEEKALLQSQQDEGQKLINQMNSQLETNKVQSEAIRDKNQEIFAKLERDKLQQQRQEVISKIEQGYNPMNLVGTPGGENQNLTAQRELQERLAREHYAEQVARHEAEQERIRQMKLQNDMVQRDTAQAQVGYNIPSNNATNMWNPQNLS